jgi:hypothetical protein
MSLENLVGTDKGIADLVRENPDGLDPKSEGDNHLRGVKNVLLNVFGAMLSSLVSLPKVGDALVWDGAKYVPGSVASATIGDAKHSLVGDANGWLVADGRLIAPGTYADLYAFVAANPAVRVTYAEKLSTRRGAFAYVNDDPLQGIVIPEWRGWFMRGLDMGANVDADGAARLLGSTQASGNLSHAHGVNDPTHVHGPAAGTAYYMVAAGGNSFQNQPGSFETVAGTTAAAASGISINGDGIPEARSQNVALYPCVFVGKA